MHIYQAEKDAGIDFQINKEGSSISFVTAQVQIEDIAKHFDGMSVADLIKSISTVQTVEELLGQDQPDLALVVAILVSTGWNLNDDVFTPEEVWKARSSALHKPMNDNHQANKILGHIVQTRVLDKSGVEIEVADGESPPAEFDIEVAGVLYRAFPELSKRIDEIIAKAQTGEVFVSMEAWFTDFGYGLIDSSTGKTNLIERTEATAFLTKHLRIYGGTGQYQGYQIGRVLKDIIFGAQGFVDEPANPDSIVKVAASKVAASDIFVTAELSELPEGGVGDVNEKQLAELQAKLEEVQASLVAKDEEIAKLNKVAEDFTAKGHDEQIAALNTKVEELTSSQVEASKEAEAAEVVKSEFQKQFDEMKERAEKSEAELDEIRKSEAARDRLAKLLKVKKVDDEEATLAELRDMTDETFGVVLKYAGEAKVEDVVVEVDTKVDTTDATTEAQIAKEKEAEELANAEAALNDAKVDDSPDLNVTEDVKQSKKAAWAGLAHAMLGHKEEKDQGGE